MRKIFSCMNAKTFRCRLFLSRIECIENFSLRYQSIDKYFDNRLCNEFKSIFYIKNFIQSAILNKTFKDPEVIKIRGETKNKIR